MSDKVKKVEKAQFVNATEKDGKITLTFLDEDRVYDVNWNKKAFDNTIGDYIDSDYKEEQVEKWSQEYFGVPTDRLEEAYGIYLTIYVYDTYASLWESQVKFTKEQKGKSENTVIDDIEVTDQAILIYYQFDGQKHRSRMSYSSKVGSRYYMNPIEKKRKFRSFEEKYGVPVEDKDKLIGKKIKVTVKPSFGYFYGDITYIDD